jgi:CBS domain containing-hemolysin-like protein
MDVPEVTKASEWPEIIQVSTMKRTHTTSAMRAPAAGAMPRARDPIPTRRTRHAAGAAVRAIAAALATLALAGPARASFLPPEMMDSMAMYVAWFVIVVVPIGAIVLFWIVHVMPEKIAHKRHHPQRDAIHTLCLLSLVFGGLLWPVAWLWAYTKPAGYRLAYGTEKHEDYFHEMGDKAQKGELLEHELAHLREELDAMAARGSLSAELRVLRRDLAAVTPAPPPPPVATAESIAAKGASA